ncbi:nose resistant to fluoxetine protein 6-like [Hyposmocoma kahamanoa]|uniref:nose resistant to fluoxetine protein 6-like n=1 Tax=Hyposmocoma kahamanoa TaxID=1477025 RepID=UPI000E6D8490|nr:nose resistant to fluoxetine protein 6-like [Hyposmocoma kahamanoa]
MTSASLKNDLSKELERSSRSTYIGLLKADLELEDWTTDKSCYNQLQTTFDNALNFTLWATWIVDSIQLPVGALYGSKYHLGNYDECLKPVWIPNLGLKTKYCLADVRLTNATPSKWKDELDPRESAEKYISTLTKHSRVLTTITWGVCIPAVCQPQSVSKLFRILLQNSHLQPMAADAVITVDKCEETGAEYVYPLGVRVFWYLLISLFVTALFSTYYMAKLGNKPADNLASKIAKSFCIKKNGLDLVKKIEDDIPVVHGMRTLTALIFTFQHEVFFRNSGPMLNGLDVDRHMDFGSVTMHSDLLTDTCLMMSGMLLAKGLIDKRGKPENLFTNLWKRYVRLIPSIAIVVFYLSSVSIHAGSGPIWNRLAGHEARMCQKNGWLNLLLLNNYINSDEMCYIILWYVPADFQLTILGLVLFYIYHHNQRLGKVVIIGVSVLAIVLPGLVTYLYELPATIIYDIGTMINIRSNAVFNSTYIRSHHRATSYLLGMGLGYVLSVYKPSNYGKVISKKTSIIIFVNLCILALGTMALGGVFYTREYNAFEAAAYAASNRVMWVVVMAVFVIICEYGELPLVNGFMSWSVFVPLSRLSYGLYLTHTAVILRNVYAARAPSRQDLFTMFTNSLGVAAFSYMLSLLMWLLIQAPVSGILNAVMSSRKCTNTSKLQENTSLQLKSEQNGSNKSKIL